MKSSKNNYFLIGVVLLIEFLLLFGFFCAGYYYHTRVLENKFASYRVASSGDSPNINWKQFLGKTYTISYPSNWALSGPYEGPVSGFSEYTKFISPSGDMSINIGLEGDNRFEYVMAEYLQDIKNVEVEINGKKYQGKEKYLAFEDKTLGVIALDIVLDDGLVLTDNTIGAPSIFRPLVVQLYYRLPKVTTPTTVSTTTNDTNNDSINTSDVQLQTYETEKKAALDIVKTFRVH